MYCRQDKAVIVIRKYTQGKAELSTHALKRIILVDGKLLEGKLVVILQFLYYPGAFIYRCLCPVYLFKLRKYAFFQAPAVISLQKNILSLLIFKHKIPHGETIQEKNYQEDEQNYDKIARVYPYSFK